MPESESSCLRLLSRDDCQTMRVSLQFGKVRSREISRSGESFRPVKLLPVASNGRSVSEILEVISVSIETGLS